MATAAASNSKLNQAEQDSSSSSPAATYTVVCRNVVFTLTRSQIETDSPNYFTTCFLSSSFAESTSHTVHTDRNPALFGVIVEYLSGYEFLPLSKEALPKMMSEEAARRNLLKDAEYFQLEGLCQALRSESSTEQDHAAFEAVLGQAYTTVSLSSFPNAFSRFLATHPPLSKWRVSPLPCLLLLKRVAMRFTAAAGSTKMALEITNSESLLTDLKQRIEHDASFSSPIALTSSILADPKSSISKNGLDMMLGDDCLSPSIGRRVRYEGRRGALPSFSEAAQTERYFADLLYLQPHIHVSGEDGKLRLYLDYHFAVCRSSQQLLEDEALPPYPLD